MWLGFRVKTREDFMVAGHRPTWTIAVGTLFAPGLLAFLVPLVVSLRTPADPERARRFAAVEEPVE